MRGVAQWKFHLVCARQSQRIFARLRVLSSRSFIEASYPHSDSLRAIIAWLEVCPRVEQLLRLQVLTVLSQGLPAPPLDVYLRYQKFLLSAEEHERQEQEHQEEQKRQEADDAITVSAKALLATDAQELPPPIAIPDLAPSQSSMKGMLGYLQDYVAMLLGWLLDT